MNVFTKPFQQWLEFSASDHPVQVADRLFGGLEQLSRNQITERVGGEVSEQTRTPVNVL